jgi:hypothetical protein
VSRNVLCSRGCRGKGRQVDVGSSREEFGSATLSARETRGDKLGI